MFGVVAVMDGGGRFIEKRVACVLRCQMMVRMTQILDGMLNGILLRSTRVISCVSE